MAVKAMPILSLEAWTKNKGASGGRGDDGRMRMLQVIEQA